MRPWCNGWWRSLLVVEALGCLIQPFPLRHSQVPGFMSFAFLVIL
ncbi:hypothetical protein SynBIOSE41_03757 [Synechococcus sp. BIOS-E4-1]|nr:hypothetical protein SynBIOSE41_03757 [Synechococcus sp. BIOS-E4-1]